MTLNFWILGTELHDIYGTLYEVINLPTLVPNPI